MFRMHIDTSVPGWNEIDAVELVGTPRRRADGGLATGGGAGAEVWP